MGQPRGHVARLLHVAGPSRRFRESPRSAGCSGTPCFWALDRPPSQAAYRSTAAEHGAAAAPRRRLASLLTAARARSAPRGPGLLQGPGRSPARPGPGRAGRPPAGLDLASTSAAGSGWCSTCSIPFPAGLKMVSHDGVWRAVYDKVPPPPPHHFRGKDKITIHEDTDGDGVFDRHKTFLDGLNIATSVRAGPRRRLGAQSAVSPLLPRPRQRRRARRRPRGPPPGLRPGGHALGRQQPALGPRRLALRRPGHHGHRPRHAARPRCRQGARPLDGPADLAISSRDAPLRGLRRGGRQRLRRRDRRQGPDLLRPQRRRHPRLPLRPGRLLPEGLQQARAAVEPLRLRLLPGDEAQPRAPVHPHLRHLRGRRPARAVPRHALRRRPAAEPRRDERRCGPTARRSRPRTSASPCRPTDPWFRPVDIKLGPDGALYIADWYDRQVNHYRNHEGQIDPATGRIYRLEARSAGAAAKPLDLVAPAHARAGRAAGRSEQVDAADGPAADRRPQGRVDRAGAEASCSRERPGQTRPRGALGAEPGRRAGRGDRPEDARARRPVRAALDGPAARATRARSRRPSPAARRAGPTIEPDVEVRSQLACSAKRLPARDALPIVARLAGARARTPATSTSRSCSGGRSRRRSRPTPRPCWRSSRTGRSGTCRSCGRTDRGAADAAVRRGRDAAGPGRVAPGCWPWRRARTTSSG